MKPALLILHGALGCQAQFSAWAGALESNYSIHTFDFSGHGEKSGQEVTFSIRQFSQDLEEYIQANNLNAPGVLGYSMGGYVALYTALSKGKLLGNIMTLATKFDWNPDSSKREAGYLKPDLMLAKVPQMAEQLKQRHGANWERVVERTAQMMLELGADPLITPATVAAIRNKVKFCLGDQDKMVSVAETYDIYKAASDATFCVMPASGHLPETIDLKRIVFEAQHFFADAARQQ